MKLTIGFSPCPNDTFIFDALVHNKIDTYGLDFEYVLEDVETLNLMCEQQKLDITKLSFNTFLHNTENYALLHSGSALGVGVGPLLVAKKELDLNNINNFHIAIPGFKTTANLLLTLAFPQAKNKTEMVFSDIEQAVINGKVDTGLLIHEGRFTYYTKGLFKLMDMGDWWQSATQTAIPLGGIAIKRKYPADLCTLVDKILQKSVKYAWKQYPELSLFIKDNAQEMNEEVMRKHINLYVNEYTADLGPIGILAIKTLFKKALDAGLLTALPEKIFYNS